MVASLHAPPCSLPLSPSLSLFLSLSLSLPLSLSHDTRDLDSRRCSPYPPQWIKQPLKKNSAFANTMAQRGFYLKPITADIDLDSPTFMGLGGGLQRWTGSPRSPPYFDTVPKGKERAAGLDEFYEVQKPLGNASRKYAASFTSKIPARPDDKGWNDLGPGSYEVNFECMCGGIRTEERRAPSRAFAPHVGGKF